MTSSSSSAVVVVVVAVVVVVVVAVALAVAVAVALAVVVGTVKRNTPDLGPGRRGLWPTPDARVPPGLGLKKQTG